MRRVAMDSSFRQRLSAAARVRALSFPTWDETASVIFSTIGEVVQDHKQQTPECHKTTESAW